MLDDGKTPDHQKEDTKSIKLPLQELHKIHFWETKHLE